jgi:hypothetical protein
MFKKDPVSRVVINTEDSYYRSIVARRQDKKRIEELESQLSNVSEDLADIKNLLQQFLTGKNYGKTDSQC